MKRALLAVLVLVAGFFLVRSLRYALAGDETEIRWLLEDEAAAFNDRSALQALRGFAEDYREETVGVDKLSLRRGILYLFTQEVDRESGRFQHRVELPREGLAIEVAADGTTARARFPLRFFSGLDDKERLAWELRVVAELDKRDEGWRIRRSRHETVSGEPPR